MQAVRLFDKSLLIQQFTRRRIVDKTIMDYIVNIWSVIEENNLIKKMSIFSAADLSRIPVPSDELSDIVLIRKTVVDLESQMHVLADSMATLKVNAVLPSTHNNGDIRTDAGHDVTPVEMVAYSTYIDMRLFVLHRDGKKVLDPELWLVGVTVRP